MHTSSQLDGALSSSKVGIFPHHPGPHSHLTQLPSVKTSGAGHSHSMTKEEIIRTHMEELASFSISESKTNGRCLATLSVTNDGEFGRVFMDDLPQALECTFKLTQTSDMPVVVQWAELLPGSTMHCPWSFARLRQQLQNGDLKTKKVNLYPRTLDLTGTVLSNGSHRFGSEADQIQDESAINQLLFDVHFDPRKAGFGMNMAMLLIYVTEGGNSSGEPLLGEREGAVISASVNLCTIDRATDSLLTASSATFVPEEFKAIVDAVSMGHLPTSVQPHSHLPEMPAAADSENMLCALSLQRLQGRHFMRLTCACGDKLYWKPALQRWMLFLGPMGCACPVCQTQLCVRVTNESSHVAAAGMVAFNPLPSTNTQTGMLLPVNWSMTTCTERYADVEALNAPYDTWARVALHALVQENFAVQQELAKLNMYFVTLHSVVNPSATDGLVYFNAPGVPDSRPALLLGDRVTVVAVTAISGHMHFKYSLSCPVTSVSQDSVSVLADSQLLSLVSSANSTNDSLPFTTSPSRNTFSYYFAVCFRPQSSAFMKMAQNLIFCKPFVQSKVCMSLDGGFSHEIDTLDIDGILRLSQAQIQETPEGSPRSRNITAPSIVRGLMPTVAPTTFTRLSTFCLNEEQQLAVNKILHPGQTRQLQIVHGPPGTGKTSTLVATVNGILQSSFETRILVCAPVFAAVDVCAERIISELGSCLQLKGEKRNPSARVDGRPRSSVLLAYNVRRMLQDVRPELKNFVLLDSTSGLIRYPSRQEVLSSRLVLSTCAGCLDLKNLMTGVEDFTGFDYVLVDEAAQATIPETACSYGMGSPAAVVALFGDHKQLGPMIRSSAARKTGLDVSHMQSLVDCNQDKFHRPVLPENDHAQYTMLVRNYRSHPRLLDISNELFYRNKLVSCANPESVETAINWPLLPNRSVPCMCLTVNGRADLLDEHSPGLVNAIEAAVVAQTVLRLFELFPDSNGKLGQEDIGVIAPYRTQVYEIRRCLRQLRLPQVKVGTIADYQGQEGRIVVVSTTATQPIAPAFAKRSLGQSGFYGHARKFNVAISRAKELLVVVGHPGAMCQDSAWSNYSNYCSLNNASMESTDWLSAADAYKQFQAKASSNTMDFPGIKSDQIKHLSSSVLLPLENTSKSANVSGTEGWFGIDGGILDGSREQNLFMPI